jgi:hypothetical protein
MKLLGSCKISENGVFVNTNLEQYYSTYETDWKRELYAKLNFDYPKFHKMDPLAKMAYLSFKLLEPKVDLGSFEDDAIVMLFANSSSSHTTDEKFKKSYYERSPSPSLFVYTLPNILTGELAILNKWYGENIFFIQKNFNPEFYLEQINFYFSKGLNICLCGWVESGPKGEECFLFVVENKDGDVTHDELYKCYKQKK